MMRLTHTSRGPLLIEFDVTKGLGLDVSATLLGENGWEERPTKMWLSRYAQGETLAEFLADRTGILLDEAQVLAAEIEGAWVEEWRVRGGAEEAWKVDLLFRIACVVAVVVAAFSLLGIALLIWALV